MTLLRSIAVFSHPIIAFLVASNLSFNGVGAISKQREFDYFVLSLQWPGTNCRETQKCCKTNACCRGSNAPMEFTIHGLWPNYNDGSWPSCCTNDEFDMKEILTLRKGLENYWPSLSCSSPTTCHGQKGSFWAHEVCYAATIYHALEIKYRLADVSSAPMLANVLLFCVTWPLVARYTWQWEKHGTCAYPVIKDEYDYFQTVLNLYLQYNVTKVLTEAGYASSDSEKYPLGGIISAIENAFHMTPLVVCSDGAVEELRLCFYKDLKPRGCVTTSSIREVVGSPTSSCPKFVSLPTYASAGRAIQVEHRVRILALFVIAICL